MSAETAGDKINLIIMLPALPSIDVVPHAATRTKKKRKKATPVAAPVAATNDASTATPTPSTAPTTKKGKTTGKMKSTEQIDLRTSPMWVSTTDLAKHRVRVIAHQQKWVAGNAETIISNVASLRPVVNGTRKGCPARGLLRETRTSWTCRHLLRSST